MPLGPASGMTSKDPRRQRIQAIGSDGLFRRMGLAGSLILSRLRLLSRSRKKTVDLGLDAARGNAGLDDGGRVQSFGLVQGYLLLLLLLDSAGSIVLLLAGTFLLYGVLVHVGGLAYPQMAAWLQSQPVLPGLMGRMGHLVSWVSPLLRWLAGLLQSTHLPILAGLEGKLGWGPLQAIPPLVAFLMCRFVVRTLRNGVVHSLRDVL